MPIYHSINGRRSPLSKDGPELGSLGQASKLLRVVGETGDPRIEAQTKIVCRFYRGRLVGFAFGEDGVDAMVAKRNEDFPETENVFPRVGKDKCSNSSVRHQMSPRNPQSFPTGGEDGPIDAHVIATDGRSFHISPPERCELKQRFADQPTVSIIPANRRSGAGVAGAFHVMGGVPLNVRLSHLKLAEPIRCTPPSQHRARRCFRPIFSRVRPMIDSAGVAGWTGR